MPDHYVGYTGDDSGGTDASTERQPLLCIEDEFRTKCAVARYTDDGQPLALLPPCHLMGAFFLARETLLGHTLPSVLEVAKDSSTTSKASTNDLPLARCQAKS